MKRTTNPFKWRHFEPEIILLCVRWYCRFQLSYRDLEAMMQERGLSVHYSTIFRWVQRYAPEINKRIRPYLKMSGTSYRIDETYIKVGRECKYLYRAVDRDGQTISSCSVLNAMFLRQNASSVRSCVLTIDGCHSRSALTRTLPTLTPSLPHRKKKSYPSIAS